MYYIYMLRCEDNSIYTGITNDMKRRWEEHHNKEEKGAKYTKARLPIELVYFEEFEDKIEAMKREYAIKQLKRREKLILINNKIKK